MYGKVFAKLFDSSLAVKGPWQALVLWPCLIALADKDGDVEKPAEIISRITLMPMEHVRVALDALSAPDPHSKSPAAEGRRIVPLRPDIDAGWHLVNYTEYAKINSGIARKERDRSRKAEERKLLKDNERKCGQSTKSPHTDTDTDTKNKPLAQPDGFATAREHPLSPVNNVGHTATATTKRTTLAQPDGFATFWSAYPRKKSRGGALRAWTKLKPDIDLRRTILSAIQAAKASPDWLKDNGQFIPYPASWLNARGWEDEVGVTAPRMSDHFKGAIG